MASKAKKSAARGADTFPRTAIPCVAGPSDDEKGRAYARLLTSPELAAHRVVRLMQPKNLADDIDVPTMLATLRDQAAAVRDGDLSRAESMLINQASALQALFVRLTERAMEQSHMPNLEGFMRLALRAQAQCRATLETLAVIKNPPVVYARQANVTTGPQQINNCGDPARPSRAANPANVQNELLEHQNADRLDSGTPSTPSRPDSSMEAVGGVDRTEDA